MVELIDKFARKITYLRVSVTDHCNFKCSYCRTEQDDAGSLRKDILNNDQLVRLIAIFTQLNVKKIRLTGGEPLLRKNILNLVARIASLPDIEDFSMSTNALLLNKMADQLYNSGLKRLNISLDSLNPKKFFEITRGGDLAQVLTGIEAAVHAGFKPIKVNMVVMKGINDDEIEPMLNFAIEKGLQLRFIETMPIGESGAEVVERYFSSEQILTRIEQHLGTSLKAIKSSQNAGPARIYQINNHQTNIGVISALSHHFCQTCNRVRLTSNGLLVLCLGQENSVSLLELLKGNYSDDQIKQEIIKAIAMKPEKHDFKDNRFNSINLKMVSLGG